MTTCCRKRTRLSSQKEASSSPTLASHLSATTATPGAPMSISEADRSDDTDRDTEWLLVLAIDWFQIGSPRRNDASRIVKPFSQLPNADKRDWKILPAPEMISPSTAWLLAENKSAEDARCSAESVTTRDDASAASVRCLWGRQWVKKRDGQTVPTTPLSDKNNLTSLRKRKGQIEKGNPGLVVHKEDSPRECLSHP